MLQTLFYIQLFGALGFAPVLLLSSNVPNTSTSIWLLTISISLVHMIGTFLLYRAFAIGLLALVAPIASSYAIVTMVLALITGQDTAWLALSGAVLVIIGGILVSRPEPAGGTATLAGVPEAVSVALCFGVYFWAMPTITPAIGILWPVMIIRVLEVTGALLLLLARGTRPRLLPTTLWWPALGAAALSVTAFVAFNIGITGEDTSIVTPLSSLASAITVLLAWALLRERLAPLQWVGVGIIIVGVLLVSL